MTTGADADQGQQEAKAPGATGGEAGDDTPGADGPTAPAAGGKRTTSTNSAPADAPAPSRFHHSVDVVVGDDGTGSGLLGIFSTEVHVAEASEGTVTYAREADGIVRLDVAGATPGSTVTVNVQKKTNKELRRDR